VSHTRFLPAERLRAFWFPIVTALVLWPLSAYVSMCLFLTLLLMLSLFVVCFLFVS